MASSKRPRIGIALSGGTLKASAHVGVLAALEALGIHPDCIAGTSAGSFVAALYAHGYSTNDLQNLVDEFPGVHLLDYGFPVYSSLVSVIKNKFLRSQDKTQWAIPNGLLRGRKLSRYFEQALSGRHPVMPYYVLATDLITGEAVVFTNDTASIARRIAEPIQDTAKVIQGSCALPGILSPVQVGNRILVDGAFRHYVPVHVLRRVGCNKIIAVNLYKIRKRWKPGTTAGVFLRAFDILLQETIDDDIEGTDLFVLTPDVSDLGSISLDKIKLCAQLGYETVYQNEGKLRAFLDKPNPLTSSADRGIVPTNAASPPANVPPRIILTSKSVH